MVLDVLANNSRFTKIISPPTVFKIFCPNLARLLKIYLPKKVRSEIIIFPNFGPFAAHFLPLLGHFEEKKDKSGQKRAAEGPNVKNVTTSDCTFFGTYILSNLAKFGQKILKTVGGDTIFVNLE